jgi:hypothetical protein
MTKWEWLTIGLKLLGVYFFVNGTGYVLHGLFLIIRVFRDEGNFGAFSLWPVEWTLYLTHGVVYFLAGVVLIFGTGWCVRWIGGGDTKGQPDKSVQPLSSTPLSTGIQDLSDRLQSQRQDQP